MSVFSFVTDLQYQQPKFSRISNTRTRFCIKTATIYDTKQNKYVLFSNIEFPCVSGTFRANHL